MRSEIFNSLYGAWRLLMLDPDGMSRFNLSVTGFWRSFLAAALVAPAYFATIDMGGPGDGNGAPEGLALVRTLQYLAGWVAFPILMIPIVLLMEWTGRYIPYVVAYNWSSVIMIAVMLPVSLIAAAFHPEQPGVTLAGALYFVVFLGTLMYGWFVARTALRINPFTAIAIVILDLITGIAISAGGNKLLLDSGGGLPPL